MSDLRNAFIEEAESRGIECGYQHGDIVGFIIDPTEYIDIDCDYLQIAVEFLDGEIRIRIINISKAKYRSKALDFLCLFNMSNVFGTYTMRDDNTVDYTSFKCYVGSEDDPDCIFEMMEMCLGELEEYYKDLVGPIFQES